MKCILVLVERKSQEVFSLGGRAEEETYSLADALKEIAYKQQAQIEEKSFAEGSVPSTVCESIREVFLPSGWKNLNERDPELGITIMAKAFMRVRDDFLPSEWKNLNEHDP